ncbi:hypothetical protein JCM10212_004463 [Sporobolomyces blumeae]
MLLSPFLAAADAHIQLEKEIMIAFLALLVWDHLATMPAEWRLMWKRQKWTLVRVSFFLNRYWVLWATMFNTVYYLGDISDRLCTRTSWILRANIIALFLFTDSILLIRVYAIFEKSKPVLVSLLALLTVEMVMMITSSFFFRPYTLPPGADIFLSMKGCTSLPDFDKLQLVSILFWLPSLVFNTAVLVLTVCRSWTVERRCGKVPVLTAMRTSGTLYFAVVVVANCVSLGFSSQTNISLQFIGNSPSTILTSIMCSRLVLSLRERSYDWKTPRTSGVPLAAHPQRASK